MIPAGNTPEEKAQNATKIMKRIINGGKDPKRYKDNDKDNNNDDLIDGVGSVIHARLLSIDVLLADVYDVMERTAPKPLPAPSDYEQWMLDYMKLKCVELDGKLLSSSKPSVLSFLMPGYDIDLSTDSCLYQEIQARIMYAWSCIVAETTFVSKLKTCESNLGYCTLDIHFVCRTVTRF